MKASIVRVTKDNYHLFDDMVYWRINKIERTEEEKLSNRRLREVPIELSHMNFQVFAVSIDSKFVGWISLMFIPKVGRSDFKGFLYVDELWVHDHHRKMGYAKLLMRKADDLATELRAVGVRLGVNIDNPVAKGLYEACGYIATGQAFTMEKR